MIKITIPWFVRAAFGLLAGFFVAGCAHNGCQEARKYPVNLATSTNCVVDSHK